MGAPSKRARKIRKADEFSAARLAREITPPKLAPSAYAWTLDDIRTARDNQIRGIFKRPADLAESMRTDDALFVARQNRLAPQRAIETKIIAAKGAGADKIANEADALFGPAGIGLTSETVTDIHGCLLDHNVAFGINIASPRADGSRVDYFHRAWPIRFVRWDPVERLFKTQTEDGGEEPIVHGDGRWVIYVKNELEPFKSATLMPAALVWARHAFAIRDWAKSSVAHGNTKVVGSLAEGVPLQKAEGVLSDEAAAFAALLRDFASSDAPVGIKPAGSTVEFVTNQSSAWQVFTELVRNAEKAAARIYLGTDGTLGSQGGAPGVDIQALFGVAATLVEGDLAALERGIKTGIIDPWCATNFGSSQMAPTRRYMLPDPDEDARFASIATRRQAFYADVQAARDAGFDLTPDAVAQIAALHGVAAPPMRAALAPAAPATTTPALRALRS